MLQNGGYINPPAIKRQHRDPYADWWDPQERRNFGEPVHEDNDMLGMFSPWDYTWTTTGPGLIMIGTFIATVLGVSGLVYLNYPDRPSYPREFEGGLERELGGPGAVRVIMLNRPSKCCRLMLTWFPRRAKRVMRTLENTYYSIFPLCSCILGRIRDNKHNSFVQHVWLLDSTCMSSDWPVEIDMVRCSACLDFSLLSPSRLPAYRHRGRPLA